MLDGALAVEANVIDCAVLPDRKSQRWQVLHERVMLWVGYLLQA